MSGLKTLEGARGDLVGLRAHDGNETSMDDYWQLKHLAQETGAPYGNIASWVNKKAFPTTKINQTYYIHPDDIPHILHQIHITQNGKEGWARNTELSRRYGVTRQSIHLWCRDGYVDKMETYGHPLFRIADVEREILLSHERHENGERYIRGRKPKHHLTDHAPVVVMAKPSTPQANPTTRCSHQECEHPGVDEPMPGIGMFCIFHADEKRALLGIRKKAA